MASLTRHTIDSLAEIPRDLQGQSGFCAFRVCQDICVAGRTLREGTVLLVANTKTPREGDVLVVEDDSRNAGIGVYNSAEQLSQGAYIGVVVGTFAKKKPSKER